MLLVRQLQCLQRGCCLQGMCCMLANILDPEQDLSSRDTFFQPLCAPVEPMAFAAYSFHDLWVDDLEDLPEDDFFDWSPLIPAIQDKVVQGNDVFLALPELCPTRSRILFRFLQRLENRVLYGSALHGIGVVFKLEEGACPPDVVINIHTQDHDGDIDIVGCSAVTGRKIVEWTHSAQEELFVKDLEEGCRMRLPQLSRTSRVKIMSSVTGKLISAVHGRLFFPRGSRHNLKPSKRLTRKTYMGEHVLRSMFLPLA